MGQFKPMVKMETTEPSVELKLKKGGEVKMQMGGRAPMRPMPGMPARGGSMPAMAPAQPSLAARRRAMLDMPAAAAPAGPVGRASRMMKEGGDTLAEHAAKPASKAHKGLKTGGVANAQGGYKGGGKVTTKVATTHPDHSPAKTGDVKLGNGGGYATGGVAKANGGGYMKGGAGYATGGVAKANGGGYMKGGAAKKAYATGGRVDSGAPVAMPQGRKAPPKPVSINRLAGTYKEGGKVDAYDEIKGMKIPLEAKSVLQQAENERAYKASEADRAKGEESIFSAIPRAVRGLFNRKPSPGAVTKTEKSVTVERKKGGAVC